MFFQNQGKIRKIINNAVNSTNFQELTDNVMEYLKSDVLTEADELLLNLVFSDKTTQQDLDSFLEKWDIEAAGGKKSLMLAYFMKMHPELSFSSYVKPRLEGLLQFYRFKNMKLVSHYLKIGRELNENGIKFLIFKGGCIKHLRPDLPRVMGDIDILVQEKDFPKVGKIVEQLGYCVNNDIHSIDVHKPDSKEGVMDIHKYIILESDKEKAFIPDLFKRAKVQNVFGIDALVPCNEDLVFISLINMIRNLTNKTSSAGVPYTLFDCKFLTDSKEDFDWNIVLDNVHKTKTQMHIYCATQFINKIVKGLLPDKVLYDKSCVNSFVNYFIPIVYQRFYLLEMQSECRKMKIKDLFSSKEFFVKYWKLKPKYFISKMKIIKNNPVFAKIILKVFGMM